MIEFTIETSLRLTQVRVSGSVNLLDFVNFLTKAQKDPQYGPALNTLMIIDADTTFVKVVPESLTSFFERIEESGGSIGWAIVAPNLSHQTLISDTRKHFVPKRLNVRVFDDEFLALQWLRSL